MLWSRLETKAIREPSGDQAGISSRLGELLRLVRPEPSELMMLISESLAVVDTKRISPSATTPGAAVVPPGEAVPAVGAEVAAGPSRRLSTVLAWCPPRFGPPKGPPFVGRLTAWGVSIPWRPEGPFRSSLQIDLQVNVIPLPL